MTRNDFKEIVNIESAINEKKNRLLTLREMSVGIPAVAPKIKVQESTLNQSMDILHAVVDLEREIEKDLVLLIRKKKKAYRAIRRLKGLERRLMELRYIDGCTWEAIAEKLEYSLRHVYRMHGHILQKF